jgi:drug/metabolite transporter (DMT)-like permease
MQTSQKIESKSKSLTEVAALTGLTLAAFAANSLVCRKALGENLIDPVSFTALRLVSGAVVLSPVSGLFRNREMKGIGGSWGSGIALFSYALLFSLAYVSLSTGTGALLLFGSVQMTMIGVASIAGQAPTRAQWWGLCVAVVGLVYLLLPGITSPDVTGAMLMCGAGVSWGIYSIRGRGNSAPALMTAGNFLRAIPPSALTIMAYISFKQSHLELEGVLLALASGMVTSGLGYVLWYRVLRNLTTTQAAVSQLLVPVLAGFGGVAFLSEHLSPRLILASVLVLGGTATAVLKR